MTTTKTQNLTSQQTKKKNARIVEFQDIKQRPAEEIHKVKPLEDLIDNLPHRVDMPILLEFIIINLRNHSRKIFEIFAGTRLAHIALYKKIHRDKKEAVRRNHQEEENALWDKIKEKIVDQSESDNFKELIMQNMI